jgi:hypothetical protein
MKKIIFWFIFILFSVFLFSEEPTPPVFENITISCWVTYDCPSGYCQYTYYYLESNPSTNSLGLSGWQMAVSNFEDDVILPEPIDYRYARVAASHHPTYTIGYYWEKWPVRDGTRPKGTFVDVMGWLDPGDSALPSDPTEIHSYKPPTIKELWVTPNITQLGSYIAALCVARGITYEGDFPDDERTQIKLSFIRKVPSLGPSPAFIGSFDHWDLFISDVSKSKDLGWVTDNNLYDSIYQRLTTGRQAAYDQNLTLVNTKLQEVIDLISQSNQSQRRDEFYYLVYYNALSLKDNIPWPCEPKLSATPNYGKHALGEIHQIEATLINQSNGFPLSGEPLTMEVVDGPNAGVTQQVLTDSQGKAIFGYTGYYEGTDKIEVRTRIMNFAEKSLPSEKASKSKEPVKGEKKLKSVKSSKEDNQCEAWGKTVKGLFAEWEGYVDFATMLGPKVMDVNPGQRITLRAVVYNFGTVNSPQTTLRFLMADKAFNSDPPPVTTEIGEMIVDPMEKGGEPFSCSQDVIIPQSITPGRYYFDACADPDDLIPEPTEWNNCASSIVSLILTIPTVENKPPDCSKAKASKDILWPPNHKLENISIQGITDPDNDLFTITVTSITQDEPTNGLGDGDTSPDGFGVGTSNPQVRSERSGKGNGRVYQINFKAVDSKGGECNGFVKVGVPHDKKDTPIDDGQNYDSTKP